jgi:hypothetical protein
VVESQFADGRRRGQWIASNIDKLTTPEATKLRDRAAKRIAELRRDGVDIGMHLFESGRCAVAHASLDGEIVDPDNAADRKRLSQDLEIIEGLAAVYIRDELQVPDSRELYRTRNRLEPWEPIVQPEALTILKAGGTPAEVPALDGRVVSVGLFPDGPIPGLEKMTLSVNAVDAGVLKLVLSNARKTVYLTFFLDFGNGKVHTNLEEGGILKNGCYYPTEDDVRAYFTFFHRVFGNATAELALEGADPIDCEVVIPMNMMMTMGPDEATAHQVEQFRQYRDRNNLLRNRPSQDWR